MSTLKVNKIENTATTNGGVQIDVDGHVQVDGQQIATSGPLSNRNMIINGSMQFAERKISENNVTSTDAYLTVDRFRQFINGLGTWTLERHASGPPGFDYSYRATCTSGNASPAAGSYAFLRYGVEKQDMQRLAWVTTGAKEFTLSFWVKSNRTGTASLTILYSDGNLRGMTKTYEIQNVNTWEHISLTFPANGLSESNQADNGVGFWIEWWFNSGSSFTGGSANTDWATLNDNQRNPTNFGLGSVNDQEFHLTGVQLEEGSKSTPFEHRSYGDELARCQRYYYKDPSNWYQSAIIDGNGTIAGVFVRHPVPMRASPSTNHISVDSFYWNNYGAGNTSVVPNGTTSSYSGNQNFGLANLTSCNNLGGSNNDQQTGQFKTRIEYSAEL